jgi:hypothetical protein
MTNYANGKIYKIVCYNTDKQYIGSTTESLETRLSRHWKHYLDFLQKPGSIYLTSFEVFKENFFEIELIENCNCKTKAELLNREKYYITNVDCVNKNRPILTKEEAEQYYASYYANNKDEIAKRHKQYYDSKREKILEWHKNNYNANKDKIKQKSKEYYMRKKEKKLLENNPELPK